MYKTLKKHKLLILVLSLSILLIVIAISKFNKNQKKTVLNVLNDTTNKSTIVNRSSKTKVSEENRIKVTRHYKISGNFLEIYDNGVKKGQYSISKLKPEIYDHAKHITSSFEKYQAALNTDYNHHWIILINKEFKISPDNDTKTNFCAIRKAMNFCVADNECPDQKCNDN